MTTNARARKRAPRPGEDLGVALQALGFVPEVPFPGLTGKRRWRWDWARGRVAVEYHGVGVGHQGVRGSFRDHEKTTEGVLAGWLVIQCNRSTVSSGRCLEWVDAALAQEGP